MKQKHIIMTIAAAVLFAVGCNDKESVWSSAVDDMDVRLTNLEKLCAEANTNITALQTIINAQADGDVIKTVTEIKSDGKVVGYTITFGKNDPITIYNGKDGNDGEAPVIGVKKHTDNVYYWTLNGEWLLDNGEMLRVTGNSGADGVSPQLKIENGYWMISYDSGSTWTQAGKATGDNGQNGNTPQLKIENGYWMISYNNGSTWTQLSKATGDNGNNGITPQLKIENGYWMISYDSGSTWTQAGKATGENGQDGNTPQLKIENGYWMISYNNGSTWTQLSRATGTNGTDGITPQLKIENDYWMISYDNGSTWTQAGKATGENGQDGDSMFLSVTQDENNVYFTLTDGTVIIISKNTAGTGDGGSGENGSGDGGDSDEIGDVYNDGVYNGYAYVDLGLPSGLKWATCNVGAANPWNYGDYFAWGETVGYGKSDPSNAHNKSYTGGSTVKTYYYWSTYKYCSGTSNSTLTKYNYGDYGVVDNKYTLDLSDDAARVNMGGSWRMPTTAEQKELINNCYWEWTDSYNGKGVGGYIVYKVKSASDKGWVKCSGQTVVTDGAYSLADAHIFLPAAGSRNKSDLSGAGRGIYWSSSLYDDNYPLVAYSLNFYSDYVHWSYFSRYYGRSVRGVVE